MLRNPVFFVCLLIIFLILALTYDVASLCSRYLYLSFELGLILFSLVLYFPALQGISWNSPAEKSDDLPQPDWQKFSREMAVVFGLLSLIIVAIWVMKEISAPTGLSAWIRGGSWFLYYGAIFIISIFIISKYLKYVHALAMVVATIIQVYILTTFEIILLSTGQGWAYYDTVLGYFLKVPVENILFVYPVAPALSIIFYAVVTRHLNNLKAFWLINGILLPCSVVVEWIGIYPLRLWYPFNQYSILPIDKTNIEEFIYYALFQFSAIVLYIFLARNFSNPRRVSDAKAK
ncbi:MAG: hypothetical protein MUF22_03995 [Chitinispirillaceae bacterium]|jgi:hypothetical protein|nr:hypothetical protein [Chitinispirillaceae bacterium]